MFLKSIFSNLASSRYQAHQPHKTATKMKKAQFKFLKQYFYINIRISLNNEQNGKRQQSDIGKKTLFLFSLLEIYFIQYIFVIYTCKFVYQTPFKTLSDFKKA